MKYVVKLGGAGLENPSLLEGCTRAIAELVRDGNQVAVVHGGGVQLTRMLKALGKQSEFIDGLRVTDAETRDVALMVLAGKVNKGLVAALGALGQPGVGLSGGDGLLFRARKKRTAPDLGFRGRDRRQRSALARRHLAVERRARALSMALGFDGEYYNINADEMAAACAIACHADALVFLTDVPGVKGRERRGAPMALHRSDRRDGQERRHLRRHVAQAERLPRGSVERRQARSHFTRRGCRFAARSVQFPRSPRHRRMVAYGGLQEKEMTKLEQIQAAEARLLHPTYDRNPVLFVARRRRASHRRERRSLSRPAQRHRRQRARLRHPVIEEAIAKQSRALIHASNLYFHEGQAELACASPSSPAWIASSSPTPAPKPGRPRSSWPALTPASCASEGRQIGTKFLALEQSFHGRTFGSMSATYKEKYREPFAPSFPASSL
jgi:acetylglutamate kinase